MRQAHWREPRFRLPDAVPDMLPHAKFHRSIGPIHFIGIGGIGMSGIAEVMINLGYQVQGSDLRESGITRRLEAMGASISIGHVPENIGQAAVVTISSAIQAGNPELAAARDRGLPVVRRAEMLAELMRFKSNIAIAGTHGKTTTTTLVATILEQGGFDPTVINGGIIRAFGSNARLGSREWMVVEADESDGTFLKLPATIAVVTNIDPEHMDHYGSIEALHSAFLSFVNNIPFYGFTVCCIDNPTVHAMAGSITDRRVVTYGFNQHADVCISGLRAEGASSVFDVNMRMFDEHVRSCRLPMPGEHNVSNATAAMTVAALLGMDRNRIRDAVADFRGVNRRFTQIGTYHGATIIDDYGHHPVEISAVLKAARQYATGRVIAIHQPHRYTRLHNLFAEFCQCFGNADIVAISDVYEAGEKPIAGADRDSLAKGLRRHGHRQVSTISNAGELASFIAGTARPDDIVICLGAGSISAWANELPTRLEGMQVVS